MVTSDLGSPSLSVAKVLRAVHNARAVPAGAHINRGTPAQLGETIGCVQPTWVGVLKALEGMLEALVA